MCNHYANSCGVTQIIKRHSLCAQIVDSIIGETLLYMCSFKRVPFVNTRCQPVPHVSPDPAQRTQGGFLKELVCVD